MGYNGERFFSTSKGISNVLSKGLRICPRCDAPLVAYQKFCSRCGTNLGKDDANIKIKKRVLGKLGKRKTYDQESHSEVIERILDETEE